MKTISNVAIGEQLRTQKFAVVSWHELGLDINSEICTEVIQRAPLSLITPGLNGDDDMYRSSRAMDERCLGAARSLATPVVERLFAHRQEALESWSVFGVNYYNQGDYLPFHRDFDKPEIATTAILSLSGVRTLTIEDCRPLQLCPGVIALVDGMSNPLHTASCVEGPSVSVVLEIPSLLY